MTKRLTMAAVDTILTLHKAGHSNREIAALLGVNRETVGKYLARVKAQYQPNAPTGNRTDDPNDGPPEVTLATVVRPRRLRTSQTRPPARQAFHATDRPANASRSGKRFWRRSSRAWRRCGFTRISPKTTATAPPATTACGGSSPGCGIKRPCRFGGWRRSLARRPRWTSAPARRCARPMARSAVRGSFASC